MYMQFKDKHITVVRVSYIISGILGYDDDQSVHIRLTIKDVADAKLVGQWSILMYEEESVAKEDLKILSEMKCDC